MIVEPTTPDENEDPTDNTGDETDAPEESTEPVDDEIAEALEAMATSMLLISCNMLQRISLRKSETQRLPASKRLARKAAKYISIIKQNRLKKQSMPNLLNLQQIRQLQLSPRLQNRQKHKPQSQELQIRHQPPRNCGSWIRQIHGQCLLKCRHTIVDGLMPEKLSSKTDHERNLMVAEIIRLYQAEYSITGIARQMGSSNDEVCRILGLESMTKLTILETKRQLSESPQFKAAECQELFYCSLSKETNTQSGIDEHTIAMAALRTDKNNIALIGAAGTGKSTLVRNFLSKLSPEERAATLVVAPTGRAADHLDAQTIHKAFQLPNDVQPNDEVTAAPKALYSISRLIIDEINMVRIDVFTKVIKTIRFIEQQTDKHIQVIVVGDFGQIQPVTTDEDMDVIKFYYPEAKGVYAFQSELWEQMNFRKIVLKYIYRQQESEFMQKLNEIKYGKLSAIDWFNKNAGSLFSCNPIYICPTNKLVDYYNKQAEDRFFPDELVSFDAVITDGTPQEAELPCPRQLRLAVGMRIMTICNADKFKNGSMGRIIKIKPNGIQVRFDNGAEVTIPTMRFKLQDGGIYEQLPVVLAYAITANKSEGMTFDEINVVPGYFAPGQLYTVLSRCKSLKNIHIIGELSEKDLIVDVAALEMTI